ncbi:MAG: hypothetical protein LBU41_00215 [Clostridiales Family XIII bacterium]|jgi:hypothetical protein|nr:hypothetical protein [Clostridiales Family XIII bacterium]
MRVFEIFHFDLKKRVLFKDTLSFIEDWLAEQEISYENMALMLNVSYGDRFEKTVKLFPGLERYRRINSSGYELTDEGLRTVDGQIIPFEYDISSVPQNWPDPIDIHVRKEDEPLVREVVRKIPRPINPGSTQIVLDNVHWFSEINVTPAVSNSSRRGSPSAFKLEPYYSNNLALLKAFDFGIKHNVVVATIERTKSHEELLDVAPIVDRLTSLLGAPTYIEPLEIIFDDDGLHTNHLADKKMSPILQTVWDELQPKQSLLAVTQNNPPIYEMIPTIYNGQETTELVKNETGNISVKKSVLKYLKPLGFTYDYFPSFRFRSVKKNKYNHVMEIWFAMRPMTWTLNHLMTIKGYNFTVQVPLESSSDTANQQITDSIVEKTAEIATRIEACLTEPLYEVYGKSPEWYRP